MLPLDPYDYYLDSIEQILQHFPEQEFTHVMAKVLQQNHNEKNQIYWDKNFSSLASLFSLTFEERGKVESNKKNGRNKGANIPSAVFDSFSWLKTDGTLVTAPHLKMVMYAQYPEIRLSALRASNNRVPKSLTLKFVTENPDAKRVLVLGRTYDRKAVGMIVRPSDNLLIELTQTEAHMGSDTVKLLRDSELNKNDLALRLASVVNTWLPGVRRTKDNETIPFNGTQVCGYTLEDSLGIIPNADKHGDYMGIELKAHTKSKLTLMTTEPDMGVYAEDFSRFMTSYGYEIEGVWRWTGYHKANKRSDRSGLTLRINGYDRNTDINQQLIPQLLFVGLYDDAGNLAAGWSMERLLGGWDAKHNETVYVFANKKLTDNPDLRKTGHDYEVMFDNKVVWCRGTSPQHLLNAILDEVIIIDPAPKYDPNNAKNCKRRTQWRVNDIYRAIPELYEEHEIKRVNPNLPDKNC
ncbi:MvaI/BcnI family restriction endonuclease [Alishewanella sp. HL-SH05]|uniref:MvaI/BcnI family restriction endonuclease n=1 Tax=Alishewanella sp. HL-SH05 TaxID=3461145 RepID=UPI0040426BCE